MEIGAAAVSAKRLFDRTGETRQNGRSNDAAGEACHVMTRTHRLAAFAALTASAWTTPASAAKCTDYSTCEQAVRNWCAGNHPRADGDDDGIPCENVCSSLRTVEEIKATIGCRR